MDKYFVGAVSGLPYRLFDRDREVMAPELVKRLEAGGYAVEVIA